MCGLLCYLPEGRQSLNKANSPHIQLAAALAKFELFLNISVRTLQINENIKCTMASADKTVT